MAGGLRWKLQNDLQDGCGGDGGGSEQDAFGEGLVAEIPRSGPFAFIRDSVQGLGCVHLVLQGDWDEEDGPVRRGCDGLHGPASVQMALPEREAVP